MKRRRAAGREIAPRLASGDSRVPFFAGLPEDFKLALQELADSQRESLSWYCQQVIIRHTIRSFKIEAPRYKRRSSKRKRSK